MNIFKSIAARFRGLDQPTINTPSKFSKKLFELGLGSGNFGVTEEQGFKQATVYTCMKREADCVAQTPLLVLAFTEGGSDKARQHPVYRVLNTQANIDMTAYTWKHVTTIHVLGYGNAFSYIERNKAGQVIGLNPMNPADVKIEGRTTDGQLLYSWTDKQGKKYLFPASDILHVRGMSFDGIIGISPIKQLEELVGRARVREEFASRFYRNGSSLGGILTVPAGFTEEQLVETRESFQKAYAGARNAGKVLMLEGDTKFEEIGVSPRDAEFIDSMKLDAASIAAAFGCPLQMINDVQTTTRASAEELFRQFLVTGLNPIFSNLEAEINIKLFTRQEQDIYYAEFLREALVEADFQAKVDGLVKQVAGGLMRPNEARAKLNMNPDGFGDRLMMASNITTLENIITGPAPSFPMAPARNVVTLEVQQRQIEGNAFTGAPAQPTIQERSRNGRKHLTKSARILLLDAFKSVGKRERQDLSKMVLKNLRSNDGFVEAINNYFADSSPFAVYFKARFQPIIESLTESLKHQIQGELSKTIEDTGEEFSAEYIATLLNRYCASSRRQLEKILAELEDDDDPAEVIDARLQEWEEGTSDANPTRAEKEAERESNRMTNALTRFFLVAGGVTKLVWNTNGSGCEICAELDGKVVGVEESFVKEGQELGKGFKSSGEHFSPPCHTGCQCTVNPA